VPATLGAIVLATVGYLVAGPALPPSVDSAVDGIQGGPLGPADVQAAAAVPERTEPPLIVAPGAQWRPEEHTERSSERQALRAFAAGPPSPHALRGYQSPLPNGRVTLPFGPSAWGSRVVDGEPFHDGLDLATFCGDRVVAAHRGIVLAAGRRYDAYMGWVGDLEPYLDRLEAKSLWSTLPIVVVMDDGNGYRSVYAHLSKAAVKKGDNVAAGDLVGYEGMTGRASGCHLHYGLFSPAETSVFGIDPDVAERMLLPRWQLARVDPQLVLPEQASTRARPTPTPSTPTEPGGAPEPELH
jgi:murein DD-endopeptidase MepM/ murein hydrolase activator NlpD